VVKFKNRKMKKLIVTVALLAIFVSCAKENIYYGCWECQTEHREVVQITPTHTGYIWMDVEIEVHYNLSQSEIARMMKTRILADQDFNIECWIVE
jgi:hypothetical protein